jgi:hypothetical protein
MTAPDRARIARHEQAVIQAEMRRLARALRPFGVLHREALKRAAGAEKWHDGGFDRALRAAVRAGAVEPVGDGFYRDSEQP